MKKNSGLGAASMSPCLRLFIDSLLGGVTAEVATNQDPIFDEVPPLRAFPSSTPLESDTNYN